MRVFVYGTLTDPATAGEVLDSYVYTGPAVLEGLHAVAGRHPTLAPGGRVGGRVLRTREVDALDAYEGLDRGLYVRVSVPARGDGSTDDVDVDVYVGDPDVLDADVDPDAAWPGEGTFAERVERYVADRGVSVRLDPE